MWLWVTRLIAYSFFLSPVCALDRALRAGRERRVRIRSRRAVPVASRGDGLLVGALLVPDQGANDDDGHDHDAGNDAADQAAAHAAAVVRGRGRGGRSRGGSHGRGGGGDVHRCGQLRAERKKGIVVMVIATQR